MTQTTITRRRALTVVAAVPAALALAVPALAMRGEDAELRQLWAKYLVQLEPLNKACATVSQRRAAYDADHDADRIARQLAVHAYWQTPSQKRLWKKHGLDPLYDACSREHRKALRIVKAIRKAKAESLFGIGVKLSVWEDWDHVHEEEFAEVIDGVRRDIAALIGVDFIAATGSLADEEALA